MGCKSRCEIGQYIIIFCTTSVWLSGMNRWYRNERDGEKLGKYADLELEGVWNPQQVMPGRARIVSVFVLWSLRLHCAKLMVQMDNWALSSIGFLPRATDTVLISDIECRRNPAKWTAVKHLTRCKAMCFACWCICRFSPWTSCVMAARTVNSSIAKKLILLALWFFLPCHYSVNYSWIPLFVTLRNRNKIW